MKVHSSRYRARRTVLAFLLLAAVPRWIPAQAESDLDPPELVSATISPGAVDTSEGPKEVEVVVRLRDSLSGLAGAETPFSRIVFPLGVTLRPAGTPRSSQSLSLSLAAVTGAGGVVENPRDVEFRGRLTVPPGAAAGDWILDRLGAQDLVGNPLNLDSLGLENLGVAVPRFSVAGTTDEQPPRIESVTVSTNRLDFSALPRNVRVLVRIRDDRAGVDPQQYSGAVSFRGERTGRSTAVVFGAENGRRIEGNALDGVYAFDIGFAQNYTPPDTYRLQAVQMRDRVGNVSVLMPSEAEVRGFPTGITVEGESGGGLDSQPPEFISLKFASGTVDTSEGAAGLAAEIVAREESGGVLSASMILVGPLGLHRAQLTAVMPFTDPPDAARTLVGSVNFPAHCESGEWRVLTLDLRDGSGNIRSVTGSDLARLGMPTRIVVATSPRLHVESRDGATLAWWRRVPGSYHLQTCRNLPDWIDVSAPMMEVEDQDVLVVPGDPIGSGDRFFRLIRDSAPRILP